MEEKQETVDKQSGEIMEYKHQTAMTTTVSTDEMVGLIKVSENLFNSGLFPNVKSPSGAFAIVLYGREIGVAAMTALNNISIIQGKPACNSTLMLTKALQSGVKVEVLIETEEGCKLLMQREGRPDYISEFTMNEAKQAGLVRPGSGYEKYPKDMLFARAVTRGLRRIAPDVILGLYSIEEMTQGQYLKADEIPVIDTTHTVEEPENLEELNPLMDELEVLINERIVPDNRKKAFDYACKNKLLNTVDNVTRWIEEFKTYELKEMNNE